MTVDTRPLHDITREAIALLTREMGVVSTLRFLNQFQTGEGDYTADRWTWLQDPELDELIEQARQVDAERANET